MLYFVLRIHEAVERRMRSSDPTLRQFQSLLLDLDHRYVRQFWQHQQIDQTNK